MSSPSAPSHDRFLYGALAIYLICVVIISPTRSDVDFIRIPGFTLLLLVLLQVIFPQFRFSKSANLIAVPFILALPFLNSIITS
ncbi:hypothetical protein V2O64_00200 [Verrucomicrobiaceae bacterium 227]